MVKFFKSLLCKNKQPLDLKKNCPFCEEKSTVKYNFQNSLNEIKKLKFGGILKCPKCRTSWFLDENKEFLNIILEENINMLKRWNNKKLKPSNKILQKLKDIGATPPDIYGNQKEFIRIPCKCRFINGEVLDKCIISFQKKPPLESDYNKNLLKRIKYLDEIENIFPSKYALNKNLRVLTTQAKEIRMGFAPTRAKAPNGSHYILNWTTDFFDMDGIKGGKLIFVNNSEVKHEREMIYDKTPYDDITYIIGDWDDEYLKLRITENNNIFENI